MIERHIGASQEAMFTLPDRLRMPGLPRLHGYGGLVYWVCASIEARSTLSLRLGRPDLAYL